MNNSCRFSSLLLRFRNCFGLIRLQYKQNHVPNKISGLYFSKVRVLIWVLWSCFVCTEFAHDGRLPRRQNENAFHQLNKIFRKVHVLLAPHASTSHQDVFSFLKCLSMKLCSHTIWFVDLKQLC